MSSEEVFEQVTLKVKALVREAREAYNHSHGFAARIVAIPEIREGLELYIKSKEEEHG